MADLTLKTEEIPDIPNTCKVNLAGAIDASTVITFQATLEKLKNEGGVRRFLLDMEGIRYVNSTGLGSLVKLADGLEKEGGVIALMRIHPKVKVVFDMLGLNAFFKIFDENGAAIEYLSKTAEGGAPEPEPLEEIAPVSEIKRPEPPPPPKHEPPPARKPAPAGPPAAKAPLQATHRPAPKPEAPKPAPQPTPPPSTIQRDQAPKPVPSAGEVEIQCAVCNVTLRVPNTGKYRCPRCFHIFERTQSGQIENSGRRKKIPVQMVLSGHDYCIEGFKRFVEVMAEDRGFRETDISSLREALTETCNNIVELAYDRNPDMVFQVLLTGEDGEITIRLADHGKQIGKDSERFKATRDASDEFDLQPHPRGGNLIRITMKS